MSTERAARLFSKLFVPIVLQLLTSPAFALDVEALVRNVEQQYMGASSRALTTMQVKTSHWERSLEM